MKLNFKYFFLISFLFTAIVSFGQAPEASYLVRIHNVTTTQMTGITGVDTGSLVYNIDSLTLFQYNGANWIELNGQKIKSLTYRNDSLTLIEGDSTFSVAISNSKPSSPTTLSISSNTATWNADSSMNAHLTLTVAATTLVISNFKAGCYGTIKITQDATGGRELVLPTGSKVINGGNGTIPLTSTPNAIDILSFYYDGINYFWNYGNNYD